MKSGEEYDVHTGWRRFLLWTQRPGATAAVKRRTRRRERREGKQLVQQPTRSYLSDPDDWDLDATPLPGTPSPYAPSGRPLADTIPDACDSSDGDN